MILGLTGGIGSGKSTAGRMLEQYNFARLDADEVVKQFILTDQSIIDQLSERFGKSVLREDGKIDRSAVARIVFADEVALRWLEDLIHPKLFAHWRACLAQLPSSDWVFEVPLLFEKSLEIWFDFTVCVATTSANQLARLAERGLSPALAEQRISKQLPLAQKIELADFVLLNDGSPKFLRQQVEQLVGQLRVRV